MAAEINSESHGGEIETHVRDYSRFTGMLKWGAILSFIIAMVVVVIISN